MYSNMNSNIHDKNDKGTSISRLLKPLKKDKEAGNLDGSLRCSLSYVVHHSMSIPNFEKDTQSPVFLSLTGKKFPPLKQNPEKELHNKS